MSGPGRASRNRGSEGQENAPQLGFFFEETVIAESAVPAAPPRPKKERDTLPGWARRAMPSPPVPVVEPEPEPQPPARTIWRVADLLREVRGHMERAYADVWVRGEVSNLRAAPSGHLYFTLKDNDGSVSAIMFRKEAERVRFQVQDGLELLLRGRVSVYEPRGQLQLIVESLEPVGDGSLRLAFEQLKRKLEAEGLFAMDRKRALPLYPRCVGIVTSPNGAVIRDFLTVAGRRWAALDVLLYPAVVQGASAAAEIAAGIAYFNRARCVDMIVVARGGGSLEDLQCFNSELVARAIAASALPVVSAVGHETDFTIADFVADLRAATPSAAAELITGALHRIEEQVATLGARLGRAARLQLAVAGRRLGALGVEASLARARNGLQRREQRVDELRFRLERAGTTRVRGAEARLEQARAALLRQDAMHRVGVMRERFDALAARLERALALHLTTTAERGGRAAAALGRYDALLVLRRPKARRAELEARLGRAWEARLGRARRGYETASRALEALSPLAVLGRGYALVFAADGTLVRRAGAVGAGEAIEVRLGTGALGARVEKVVEGA